MCDVSCLSEVEVKYHLKSLVLGTALGWGGAALGTEYHSHGLLGVYQAKETVRDASDKTISNDQEALLGRLYFDATRIGGVRSQFTFDVRDRYDSFSTQDQDRPRLVAGNDAQVRQLAIKYPFESGRLYAALGRVPIVDAAVLANDGLDLAYRITNRLRIGGFGGLYPELRFDIQPQPLEGRPQLGLYGVYDDKSSGWDKHTLISSAVVSRGKIDEEGTSNGGAILGNRENPTLMWFANAVHQASPETRYTGMAQVDVAPQPFARNIWLGWHSLISPKVSSRLSLIRIDPTGYNRQRDALDALAPSVLTRFSMDLRHRLTTEWTLLYDAAFGMRSLDQRSRFEGGSRLLRSGLLKGRLNVYAGAGIRKNYASQDMIVRSGASYAWNMYDVAVHQQFISENRDAGDSRNSLVTDVTGSTIFRDHIFGTLTVEYAQAGTSRILSGMAGLGFRLGSGQATPPGQFPVPPTPVERL